MPSRPADRGDLAGRSLPAPPPLVAALPDPFFSGMLAEVRRVARTRPGGVVDLARGNPEVPPPPAAIEVLRDVVTARPELHGYPPFAGTRELREALARRHRTVFGVDLDPEREVVVVPGSKTGLALVCMALAGAADAVLVPDPGYPDCTSAVALAQADLVRYPLDPAAGWAPDLDAVPARDLARARLAYLNYPSNPVGACAPDGAFAAAVDLAARTGMAIVHDLAYGELVFDGRKPASFLTVPGAREVGVELVTMSKTCAMAGWRIGFVCGNEAIVARVRALLDHLTVGVFAPLQLAAAVALDTCDGFVADLRARYRARHERIASVLGTTPSPGSYYHWWRLPPHLGIDALMHDHGVALAPGAGFGPASAGWARISVVVDDDVLDEGLARLGRALG